MSTRPSPLLMHRTYDTGHLERTRFSFSTAAALSSYDFRGCCVHGFRHGGPV
jgi:hypothetical protein